MGGYRFIPESEQGFYERILTLETDAGQIVKRKSGENVTQAITQQIEAKYG